MHRFFRAAAPALLGALLLGAPADGQPLRYDPYVGLPGAERELGLALLPASTPDITKVGEMSTTDLMAKYSIDGRLEVGARASLGLLHDGADAFSAVTLGGRWSWKEGYAVALNLTPYNETEEIGLSLGAQAAFDFPEFALDTELQVGLLDAYAPVGADLHLLLRPSRQLQEIDPRLTGYLDLAIMSNTDALGDFLSVLVGPNAAFRLPQGWQINSGVFFSVLSGDFAADTELGFQLAVQRHLSL